MTNEFDASEASVFWYLSDPRSDEEVAAYYHVRENIPRLTAAGKEHLQDYLRKRIIRDRQRLRERAEVWINTKSERSEHDNLPNL